MHDTTRADEAQAELSRRAHQMIPHPGSTPPAMDAEALATAVHRAGLARMRAHSDPPSVVRLLQVVSLIWLLWSDAP